VRLETKKKVEYTRISGEWNWEPVVNELQAEQLSNYRHFQQNYNLSFFSGS
jgi:L-rhamnose mutarotase